MSKSWHASSARTKRRRVAKEVNQIMLEMSNSQESRVDVEENIANQVPCQLLVDNSSSSEANSSSLHSVLYSDSDACEPLSDDKGLDVRSIREKIREWAVGNNITHVALKKLLGILQPSFKDLPLDPITLLRTQRVSDIVPICGGSYCHIGIKQHVLQVLEISFGKNNFQIGRASCRERV